MRASSGKFTGDLFGLSFLRLYEGVIMLMIESHVCVVSLVHYLHTEYMSVSKATWICVAGLRVPDDGTNAARPPPFSRATTGEESGFSYIHLLAVIFTSLILFLFRIALYIGSFFTLVLTHLCPPCSSFSLLFFMVLRLLSFSSSFLHFSSLTSSSPFPPFSSS